MAFGGTAAVRVMKGGDFLASIYPGTEAGILAAVAAIGVGIGEVFVGPGDVTFASTLDLTLPLGITIRGSGPRRTRLIFSTTSTAAINAATSATRFVKIADMSIQGSAGVAQTVPTAGGYGIRNTGGVGYSLIIDHCEVNFFKNSGIFIEGGTGPTLIRDCSIQGNAGYGVEVVNQGGASPQDVKIEGGNIQTCLGGVLWNQAFSCHLLDCDIELDSTATLPCVNVLGASYGNSITDCSLSIGSGASPSPNCIVNMAAGIGNVISGGINSAKNGGANIIFGATADLNTVIGGEYTNKTPGGGFFSDHQGGTRTTYICPLLVGSTYTAGKDKVNDTAAHFTFAMGVKTAQRNTDTSTFSATTALFDALTALAFTMTGDLSISGNFRADNTHQYQLKNTLAVFQRALGAAADEVTYWPIRSGSSIQWNNFANTRNNMSLTDAGALSTFAGITSGSSLTATTRLVSAKFILTDAATIAVDASLGNFATVTLTANRIMGAPTNPTSGQFLSFKILQDGTGGWTLGWNAAFKTAWVDTGNTLNKFSTIAFWYDGANWIQDGAQSPYI